MEEMMIIRQSGGPAKPSLGARSATLADLSPVSGIGTVSKVAGLNIPDGFCPNVTMSYTNAGATNETLILFDSCALIEQLLNPATPVFPTSTNFGGSGSNTILRAFFMANAFEFAGFNYQINAATSVIQSQQLAQEIRYVAASGPQLDQKTIDPNSFSRNTAQNQFLLTFEADILIKANRAMLLTVVPGATVLFSFYTKVQFDSFVIPING